jgi:hypothetical protein
LFLFAILTIVSCKKKPKESIYPLSTEEVTQTVELGKEILMEEGTVLPAIK